MQFEKSSLSMHNLVNHPTDVLKSKHSSKTKLVNSKRKGYPNPDVKKELKSEIEQSTNSSSENSENEVRVPRPINLKKEVYHQRQTKLVSHPKQLNSEYAESSGSDSSVSKEKMPLPKLNVKKKPSSDESYFETTKNKSVALKRASISRQSTSKKSCSENEEGIPTTVNPKKHILTPRIGKKQAQNIKRSFNSAAHLPIVEQLQSSTSSSDTEDEVPRPKIIKKRKPPSDEETDSETTPTTYKKGIASKQSDSEDSSENEANMPTPINPKKEIPTQMMVNKQTKATKKYFKDLSVPSPIVKKTPSDEETDSETTTATYKKGITSKQSDREDSSEDESNMPIPINPKKEILTQIMVNKQTKTTKQAFKDLSVPSPIVKKQLSLPQPKVMVKKRKLSSDESDSETGQVRLPKPIVQKKEITSESEEISLENENFTTLINPKKILDGISDSSKGSNKSSARSQMLIKKEQISLNPKDSSSNSDGEVAMPRPKIKNEKNKRNQKVPKPKVTKKDSLSSDNDSENELTSLNQLPKKKSKEFNKEVEFELHTPRFKPSINVLQNVVITPSSQPTTWEEKVTQRFPNTEIVNADQNLLELLTENISILRIPKNIDPYTLINKKLKSNKETRFNINDRQFVIRPVPKQPDPTLVVANSSKILNIERIYILEKDVEIKQEPEIIAPEKSVVPFPSDLKPRHPLFGAKYKKKIKLSSDVQQKLDAAIQNLIREEKRKKKKKKRDKKRQQLTHSTNQVIFDLLNQKSDKEKTNNDVNSALTYSESKSKKSKIKNKPNTNLFEESINNVINNHKHNKHNETNRLFEESMKDTINKTSHKHKRNSSNEVLHDPSPFTDKLNVIDTKPKKHKKRKDLEESMDSTQETYVSYNIETTPDNQDYKIRKHKKKKHKETSDSEFYNNKTAENISGESKREQKSKYDRSVVNSTVIPGLLSSPGFSNDISEIGFQTPAKKHKKKNKNDLISELLGKVQVDIEKKSKKKRHAEDYIDQQHKKGKIEQFSERDIVEESISGSPKHKKKRKHKYVDKEEIMNTILSRIKKERE